MTSQFNDLSNAAFNYSQQHNTHNHLTIKRPFICDYTDEPAPEEIPTYIHEEEEGFAQKQGPLHGS